MLARGRCGQPRGIGLRLELALVDSFGGCPLAQLVKLGVGGGVGFARHLPIEQPGARQ
jgi:hypothetical protein